MKRILKWNIPVDDQYHEIGSGPVAHVACQAGPDSVQVWTVEPAEEEPLVRTAFVVGTGHTFGEHWQPVGSVVTASGALVWHVIAQKDTEVAP